MIKQKLKKILIIMTIIILAISTQQVNAETFENNEIESTYTLAQIEAKGGTMCRRCSCRINWMVA